MSLLFRRFRAHEETATLFFHAQTRNVLLDGEFTLVPLIVKCDLLTRFDLPGREKPDLVQSLAFNLAAQVEWLDVWIAAVVNEAWFIAKEHGVDAQGEELVVVGLLYLLLTLLFLHRVVHIEQVAQSLVVIEGAAHISMLFSHNFALVLAKEGTLFDISQGEETPHRVRTLLDSPYLHLVLFLFWLWDQGVVASVFITTAQRVALVKVEDFIWKTRRPRLNNRFLTVFWTCRQTVSRIHQFSIPLVANTWLWILTAVLTGA